MRTANAAALAWLAANPETCARADLIRLERSDWTDPAFQWTTWDAPLIISGVRWNDATQPLVRRAGSVQAAGLTADTLDIDIVGGDFTRGGKSIHQLALSGYFDGASARIHHLIMPTPGETSLGIIEDWFRGRVAYARPHGATLTLRVKTQLDRLNVQLPRFAITATCGNAVYDGNCGLSTAGVNSDGLAYSQAGTVSWTWGLFGPYSADGFSGYAVATTDAPACTAAQYGYLFDGGWATVTSGTGATDRVPILHSAWDAAHSRHVLILRRAPSFTVFVGSALSAVLGCDRTYDRCSAPMRNTTHFRGVVTGGKGDPVALAYGTVKAPALPVYAWSSGGTYSSWIPSHAYQYRGERALKGTMLYEVVTPGTSAASGGPAPSALTDGTVVWTLVRVAVSNPAWAPSTAYSLSQVVTNGGEAFVVVVAGTSGTGGGPSGTGLSFEGSVAWLHTTGDPNQPVYSGTLVAVLCEGQVDGAASGWWGDSTQLVGGGALGPFGGRGLTATYGPDALGVTLPYALSASQTHLAHAALLASTAWGSYVADEQPDGISLALEIQNLLGASSPDAAPLDIINDLLFHVRRGAGFLGALDADATASGYRTYCDAAGFRLSLLVSSRQTALSIIRGILDATNSDAVMSGNKLRIVPLGVSPYAVPTYGATGYVPSLSPVAALGVDDFLDVSQPVQIERRADSDCYNAIPVQYTDRSLAYVQQSAEYIDDSDVLLRQLTSRGASVSLPVTFPGRAAPTELARILVARSLGARNTYTFRLDWRYMLLEPLDIVSLTEPMTGLSGQLARITRIDEGEDRTLTITAVDLDPT